MYRQKDHWGTYLWGYIHTICIIDFQDNQPFVDKTIANLIELKNAIACPKCSKFYGEYLEKLDTIDKTESMVLFKWSVDLHNAVNRKMGKEEWSFEDALKKWTICI